VTSPRDIHRWPNYWLATVAVAVFALGLPALLFPISSGVGTEPLAPAQSLEISDVQVLAPSGWTQQPIVEGVRLTKGAGTIELAAIAWEGTPEDLFQQSVDAIGNTYTVTSSSDPTPTAVAGMPAATGTIHYLRDGTDIVGTFTAASDGVSGILIEIYGPVNDVAPLQDDYESLLSTISVPTVEAS
jgi:hypothetical protein